MHITNWYINAAHKALQRTINKVILNKLFYINYMCNILPFSHPIESGCTPKRY